MPPSVSKEGAKYGVYQTRMVSSEAGMDRTSTGLFRVAEEKVDGCLQIQLAMSGRKTPATLCGEVLTRMDDLGDVVFHKRR